MGEIEEPDQPPRSLLERARQGLAGLIVPGYNRLADRNRELEFNLEKTQRQNASLTSDIGLFKSDVWKNLAIGDFNPDLVSISEYMKMMRDAQVRAGFDLIAMGVLMKPWKIRHPDREIVEILTKNFKQLENPSIRNSMKAMLTAIPYGFSTTEVVFEDYHGKWLIRQTNGLKTLNPEYIKFYSDPYGKLVKIEEKITNIVELPLERMLVWSHEFKYGNWYGESILNACYKNWFIKDAMLKFANIAYERFGSPILLGTAPTPQDVPRVLDTLSHLYARSQGVLVKRNEKDPTSIDVLESKRKQMPFDAYIRYQDEMILRRMLIGQRLFEGGGGTYGPKVPFDIVLMRFEDFRLELVEIENELLRLISRLNWDLEMDPWFEFAPLTTMDMEAIRSTIMEAIDKEIIMPDESWIRDELGFPPKEQSLMSLMETLPGRYLARNHAKWLASGYKKIIVSSRPYYKYNDQEIYIIGEGGIYGTMIEGPPEGPFGREIEQKYDLLHRISKAEWEEWWPKAEEFWIWKPKVLKRFNPPLPFKPVKGTQTYISEVVPREETEPIIPMERKESN